MAKREKQVRYVSPFGSPAWMTRQEAERHLAEDDRQWEFLSAVSRETGEDVIGETRRTVGAPRIEVHQ